MTLGFPRRRERFLREIGWWGVTLGFIGGITPGFREKDGQRWNLVLTLGPKDGVSIPARTQGWEFVQSGVGDVTKTKPDFKDK